MDEQGAQLVCICIEQSNLYHFTGMVISLAGGSYYRRIGTFKVSMVLEDGFFFQDILKAKVMFNILKETNKYSPNYLIIIFYSENGY